MRTKTRNDRRGFPLDRGALRPAPSLEVVQAIQEAVKASGLDGDHPVVRHVLLRLHAGRLQGIEPWLARLTEAARRRQVKGAAPFSVLTVPTAGIALGETTDGINQGELLRIPPDVMRRHLGFYGITGSGKSWAMMWVARQLMEQGITVWIFDRSTDFRRLVGSPGSAGIRYLRPDWLEWNPLQAPVHPWTWRAQLIELITSTFYGRGGAELILSSSLDLLYRKYGCYDGSGRWPTIKDWWELLERTAPSHYSRNLGYHESAQRVIHAIRDGVPGTLASRSALSLEQLARTSFVLDMSEMSVSGYLFMIMGLIEQTSPQQDVQELKRVIFIDEASEIFNEQQVRRQDHGYPPQHDLPRRFRGRGIGLALADQTPSLLPRDVQSNLGTTVSFRVMNGACIRMMTTASGLSEEQAAMLLGLPAQHAIVSSVGLSKPYLVRIPDLALPMAPTLQELERRKEEMLAGLFIQTTPEARDQSASPTREEFKESIAAGPVTAPSTNQPSASPQGESSKENTLLTSEHIRLLERLGKYPQETISERSIAERLDRMDEWKLRNHLMRFGYVSLLGKIGKHELFGITSVGAEFLKARGIDLPTHKSGVFHECIIRRIEEDVAARAQRITTSRHGQYNGVQPDLMLTNAQGGAVMLQVSCTNSAANEVDAALRLASIEAVTRVLVVCTTQAKVAAVKKTLARLIGQPGGLFTPAGEVEKVVAIHAEDVLQQRLDWLELSKPKAARQGHPDPLGGVLKGEAAEAGGKEAQRANQGEEGSRGIGEPGSREADGGPELKSRPAGEAEDGPGSERLREPEGQDEARKGFQERQGGRGLGGEQEAVQGTARPGGRAEGDGRGQGTEAGADQSENMGRGPGPEPEAREGDAQGTRDVNDDRERDRREPEEGRKAGETKARKGVSPDKGRRTAGAKSSGVGIEIQPEAGARGRQRRERTQGDRSRSDGTAGQEGGVEDSKGEGAATMGGEIREGGATRENDGRTTTNVKEELRTVVRGGEKKEGRNLNLKACHDPAIPAILIDLAQEEVITLRDAASRLPRRNGKKVHVSTLYRWLLHGVRGVRLEAIQVGGSLCTSAEALQRFCATLSRQGQRQLEARVRTRLRKERTQALLKSGGLLPRSDKADSVDG